MFPVQGKSAPVQVKKPYGNLDMVTCRLSSCNPECKKYTCQQYSQKVWQYIDKERQNIETLQVVKLAIILS